MRRPKTLALLALAALVAGGCGGGDEPKQAAAAGSCPDGRVRFGIEPFEDPAKLRPVVFA
ncbi:MAG: phosphate/phosphite/phosphonate ABC transporter substrate-binding protein, partial [Thermoleophilaceae bacterium]|nr:phosphate/phosphite/phosphonate ABC transporter substrate-binding protein [Thermoleophilaceae bacterium]